MTTIEVLEPAGRQQELAVRQPRPLGPLKGLRLSILDNQKPNFGRLATLAAESLREEFALASVAHHCKENAMVPAAPELLDRIAASSDLVLTGSAD